MNTLFYGCARSYYLLVMGLVKSDCFVLVVCCIGFTFPGITCDGFGI